MKATVDAKSLASAVATVAPFVPRSHHLAVISGIRIEADDDGLRFTATDLDQTCTTRIDAEVTEAGDLVAPGRTIARMVSRLRDQATITTDDLDVTFTDDTATLAARLLPADEWPRLTWPDVTAEPFDDDVWQRIQRAAVAASLDDTRPALCGVRFEPDGTVVTTDSYRLAWASYNGTLDALVPSEALRRAAKILAAPVSMACTEREALFTSGDTSMLTRLIEVEFPRWRSLVPPDTPHHLEVDAAELADAIATVNVIGEGGAWPARLTFHVDAGLLEVAGRTQDVGTVQVTVAAAGTWPCTVGYNPAFLSGLLAAVGTETVTLNCTDAMKPMTVTGGDVDGLIMPVRTS